MLVSEKWREPNRYCHVFPFFFYINTVVGKICTHSLYRIPLKKIKNKEIDSIKSHLITVTAARKKGQGKVDRFIYNLIIQRSTGEKYLCQRQKIYTLSPKLGPYCKNH